KMAKECKSMMSQTREALILFDASIAYDVGTKDDIVDGLYEQVLQTKHPQMYLTPYVKNNIQGHYFLHLDV
ncbi:PhoU domain-containing protein, partial [Clostridioides difficile]|uniref:PhoU domain-containing protein n=1 Tax=Clostridioides difficile TaxID=1496 RepID=UPI001F3F81C0